MDGNLIHRDGLTIRAVNGKKEAVSAEISQKKLEYAKAQLEAVEKYLQTLDENDLHEKRLNKPMAQDLDKDHLPDREKLKKRIAFHKQCLKELAKSDRGALLFIDPEAGMMPAKEAGIKACYNVQTAVDAGSHMIVDFDVINNSSDRGTLNQTAEKCKREISLDSVIGEINYFRFHQEISRCLLDNFSVPANRRPIPAQIHRRLIGCKSRGLYCAILFPVNRCIIQQV